jgi:hypothetical protein
MIHFKELTSTQLKQLKNSERLLKSYRDWIRRYSTYMYDSDPRPLWITKSAT